MNVPISESLPQDKMREAGTLVWVESPCGTTLGKSLNRIVSRHNYILWAPWSPVQAIPTILKLGQIQSSHRQFWGIKIYIYIFFFLLLTQRRKDFLNCLGDIFYKSGETKESHEACALIDKENGKTAKLSSVWPNALSESQVIFSLRKYFNILICPWPFTIWFSLKTS